MGYWCPYLSSMDAHRCRRARHCGGWETPKFFEPSIYSWWHSFVVRTSIGMSFEVPPSRPCMTAGLSGFHRFSFDRLRTGFCASVRRLCKTTPSIPLIRGTVQPPLSPLIGTLVRQAKALGEEFERGHAKFQEPVEDEPERFYSNGPGVCERGLTVFNMHGMNSFHGVCDTGGMWSIAPNCGRVPCQRISETGLQKARSHGGPFLLVMLPRPHRARARIDVGANFTFAPSRAKLTRPEKSYRSWTNFGGRSTRVHCCPEYLVGTLVAMLSDNVR